MLKITSFLFCLFSTLVLYSLPVENISAPSIVQEGFFISDECWFNFRIGFEGDALIERRLKVSKGDRPRFGYPRFHSFFKAGILVFNFKERLDLYIAAGSAISKVDFHNDSTNIRLKTHEGFAGYGGGKLVLLEMRDTSLGVDVKYYVNWASTAFYLQNDVPVSTRRSDFKLREWQISVGVAQNLKIFFPYAGVDVTDFVLKLKPFDVASKEVFYLRHRHVVGIFLGCTVSTNSYFMANIEARLINETAMTVSGEMRF